MQKVGRNAPCPCGSGRKYKQCCGSPGEVRAGSAPPVSALPSNSLPFDSFQAALAHHQAGRLPQAEAICRQLLQGEPSHSEALHLLGLIAHQAGQSGIAVELISKATGISASSQMYCNLGVVLYDQGRFKEAEASYRRALELKPDFVNAHNNLGNTLRNLNRPLEAEACFRQALVLKPDYVNAHFNLGLALSDQRRFLEAEASYRRALALKPDYAEAHNSLGNTLRDLGQLDEAFNSYRRALEINPNLVEAHCNLGNVLRDRGQLADAAASFRRALALKPDYVEAYINLGAVLRDCGKLDEAFISYRLALEINPDHVAAHCSLGNTLRDMGQLADAVASFRRALELKPDYAEAHINLGVVLQQLGQLAGSVASFRRAIELKPDLAEAQNNLGTTYLDMGRLDEAEASYRRALQIKPDYEDAFGNLLFALNYHPDKSGVEIFEDYREYDARFGLPHRSEWRPHGNNRETNRRLKVGYVSPDFRKHSVRHFLEPLLAHHDKNAVEVYVYAELVREDEVTARYKSYADHWLTTIGMSDATLSERIRADGIDILVDLAGHSASNRLGVFARKPSPVSLSWLGYGYTTGLTAIDYLMTDDVCAPPGCENVFSEKPWRLTTPGYVYRPAEDMWAVNPLPAMGAGQFTFGALSRGIRINHRVIRVWSEILKRVEGARLVIDSKDFIEASAQDILAGKFAAHGIGRDQLQIGFHSPPWDTLRGIDIGLDCFPHNSGTTLFETLYMGIPYITLAGRPSVGRLGGSVLEGVGHPEWIAKTEDEYIEKAVVLAGDLPKLAALRAGLRQEMQAGPVMDELAFARKVERAYLAMFEKWAHA